MDTELSIILNAISIEKQKLEALYFSSDEYYSINEAKCIKNKIIELRIKLQEYDSYKIVNYSACDIINWDSCEYWIKQKNGCVSCIKSFKQADC